MIQSTSGTTKTKLDLTEQTIAFLEKEEAQYPGSVNTLIVLFDDDFSVEQSDFLLNAERTPQNRWQRHEIFNAHADRVQMEARRLLYDRDLRSYYAQSPHFSLETWRHVKVLPIVNAILVPGNRALAEEIARQPYVAGVFADFPTQPIVDSLVADLSEVRVLGGKSSQSAHRDGYTWGWDELGVRSYHRSGKTGTGVSVGIVDTGVYANHADLIFKVKDWFSVMSAGSVEKGHSVDIHGHGTHVAGTIAGAHNSGVHIGGAPRVDIRAAGVFTVGRSGKLQGMAADLLAAINWLATIGVRVINLSLSVPSPSSAQRLLLDRVFERLQLDEVICTAAIGNVTDVPAYPAALQSVIGCGALTPDGRVWESSGTDPDFVLPGVSVYSCVPHASPSYRGQNYAWMTGTSMATAHMSALVALCLEQCTHQKIREIIDAFKRNAKTIEASHKRAGHGVPDLARTLASL